MAESNDPKDRRRFQRVHFETSSEEGQTIPGVKAVWLEKEKVSVYDISYTGAALERPPGLDLKVCHTYPVHFEFEGASECEVEAEVMWFNEKLVGVAFGDIGAESRMVFNQFLDDKLIGANLVEVSRDLYGPNLDCNHWFRGPQDTNVMIWLKNGQVSRVVIELLSDLHFEWNEQKVLLGDGLVSRARDILSQLDPLREILTPVLTNLREQG